MVSNQYVIVIGVLKLLDDGSEIIAASLKARSAEPSVARADGGTDRHLDRQHQAATALAQEQDQPDRRQEGEGKSTPAQTGGVGDEGATSAEP